MANDKPNDTARLSNSAKRPWVAPEIEIARAREAEASFRGSGGIDYGVYS